MQLANRSLRGRARVFLIIALVAGSVAVAGSVVVDKESRHIRNRFWVKQDNEVIHVEPAPHDGKGQTKAYRYFDEVKDAGVIFRKRAMPKGSDIGMHVLAHDEVYYVVSGRGELIVDDAKRTLQANTAAFMHEGANVGIRQLGDEELVIIAAYPPAK